MHNWTLPFLIKSMKVFPIWQILNCRLCLWSSPPSQYQQLPQIGMSPYATPLRWSQRCHLIIIIIIIIVILIIRTRYQRKPAWSFSLSSGWLASSSALRLLSTGNSSGVQIINIFTFNISIVNWDCPLNPYSRAQKAKDSYFTIIIILRSLMQPSLIILKIGQNLGNFRFWKSNGGKLIKNNGGRQSIL